MCVSCKKKVPKLDTFPMCSLWCVTRNRQLLQFTFQFLELTIYFPIYTMNLSDVYRCSQLVTKILLLSSPAHISTEQFTAKIIQETNKTRRSAKYEECRTAIWEVIPTLVFLPLLAILTVSATENSLSSGRSTEVERTIVLSFMDKLNLTRFPKFNKWNQSTTQTIENFTINFTQQGFSHLPERMAARTGSPLTPLALCILN